MGSGCVVHRDTSWDSYENSEKKVTLSRKGIKKLLSAFASKTHHWTLYESHLRLKGLKQEPPQEGALALSLGCNVFSGRSESVHDQVALPGLLTCLMARCLKLVPWRVPS